MILIPNFVQEGRAKEAQRLIESRWQNLEANGEITVEQAVNLGDSTWRCAGMSRRWKRCVTISTKSAG